MISDCYQTILSQAADGYGLVILHGRTFSSPAMVPAYDEARFVSERQFNRVPCTMIAVGSIFTLAHIYIQVRIRRPVQSQDYLVYTAFDFSVVMSICYVLMAPRIYLIGHMSKDLIQPSKH